MGASNTLAAPRSDGPMVRCRDRGLNAASTLPSLWPRCPLGIWLVRRVPAKPFHRLLYACQFVISLKLLWDGLAQIMR